MPQFVLIKTFFNRYEAEEAKGLLDEQGIISMVSADDCGGFYSGLTLGTGNVRLLVDSTQVDRAKTALEVLED